jgi:hypothetical protein
MLYHSMLKTCYYRLTMKEIKTGGFMTIYDGINICVSLLALWISYKANNKSNKLLAEANNLQKNQSELAAMQKDLLNKKRSEANCQIELIKLQGTKYKFNITNISQTNAHDVNITFKGHGDKPDFIKQEKFEKLFPVKTLSPTQSVSISTHRDLGCPSSYDIILSWNNPDGSYKSTEVTLFPE